MHIDDLDDIFFEKPKLDLSKLNPKQYEAVTTTEGPLLVLAGAGSGKTQLLTHRVAHLVLDKDVPPENVLAITFTNKATREMRSRIAFLIGPECRLVRVGTFHRTCLDILRAHPERLDLPAKFGLVNPDDARKIVARLCGQMARGGPVLEAGPAYAAISRAKNELVTPEDMAQRAKNPFHEKLAQIYSEYNEHLQASKVLDLDDILMECHRLLQTHPDVLATYQNLFRYIHIDEYQDTCHAQYRIAHLLAAKHHNIMVVGDDDQAVYGFRAADVRNILNFERDYPGAKVITLGTNYRSTPNIISVASAIITHNRNRRAKTIDTPNKPGSPVFTLTSTNEQEEARAIVKLIQAKIRLGLKPADIAVLYRIATLSSDLETAFLRAGIQYEVVRGIRYVDRKVVRDALAYIATAIRSEDEISLRRIANTPRRGLGEATLERVAEIAKEQNKTLRETLKMVAMGQVPIPPKGRLAVASLVSTLEQVAEALSTDQPLHKRVEAAIQASGLLVDLSAQEKDAPDQDSAGDLMKLVDVADTLCEERPDADVSDLLDFLALQSEADETDADGDLKVKLLTIHASKGLEFHAVFVVGMEDGVFPHRRAASDPKEMEEERRLAYVAVTRAKAMLTLSTTQSRRMYGERKMMPPSRFIGEIPPSLLHRIRT